MKQNNINENKHTSKKLLAILIGLIFTLAVFPLVVASDDSPPGISMYLGQKSNGEHNTVSYYLKVHATLWNKDSQTDVSQCKIDWGDGNGWQDVKTGNEGEWYSVNHEYSNNGEKTVKYKCKNSDGAWTEGNEKHHDYDEIEIDVHSPTTSLYVGEEEGVHNDLTYGNEVYAHLWNDDEAYDVETCQIDWDDGNGWQGVNTHEKEAWFNVSNEYSSNGEKTIKYRCRNKEGTWSSSEDSGQHTSYDTINVSVGEPTTAIYLSQENNSGDHNDISYSNTIYAHLWNEDSGSDVTSCEISWDDKQTWNSVPTGNEEEWQIIENTYSNTGDKTIWYRCENDVGIESSGNEQHVDYDSIEIREQQNRDPSIDAISDKTVDEGNTLSFDVSASDPDGDSLSYSVTSGPGSMSGSTYSYSAPSDGDTDDEFHTVSIEVSDGNGGIDSESFVLTINDLDSPNSAPVAENDSYSINENSGSHSLNVLANDSDPDGDLVEIVSVTKAAHGNISVSSDNRSINYTVEENYAGSDSFVYTISDGNLTDTATVDIEIEEGGTNNPPVLDEISDKEVDEGEKLLFKINATDEDDSYNDLTFSAESLPQGASFEENTFEWTPDSDQDGNYTVKFIVSDGNDEDSQNVVIEVLDKEDEDDGNENVKEYATAAVDRQNITKEGAPISLEGKKSLLSKLNNPIFPLVLLVLILLLAIGVIYAARRR